MMNTFLLNFANISKINRHQKAPHEPLPKDFRHFSKTNLEVVYISEQPILAGNSLGILGCNSKSKKIPFEREKKEKG